MGLGKRKRLGIWGARDQLKSYLPLVQYEKDADGNRRPLGWLNPRRNLFPIYSTLCVLLFFIVWKLNSPACKPYDRKAEEEGLVTATFTIKPCQEISTRHEWRSLSMQEKDSYLSAVRCLSEKPSRLGLNGTLWDDFPYTYARIGVDFKESAVSLPWHRYFLQVYENALREDCGFDGNLPYWDWSLDWEDLAHSPIWNSEKGFGGGGDIDEPVFFERGSCLGDGPFAGIQVSYHFAAYHPHCLSRGFLPAQELLDRCGSQLQPRTIEKLLREDDYEQFLLQLENGPNAAVNLGVGGDLSGITSPNDPIFFLHHAQLDRLWWLWQLEDPERLFTYNGKAKDHLDHSASLDDPVNMNGLAPDVAVSEMMMTESSGLCYRY